MPHRVSVVCAGAAKPEMRENQLIYGIHAVRHALQTAPEQALELWLQKGRNDAALASLEKAGKDSGVATQRVERKTLEKLVAGALHQGVALRRRTPTLAGEAELRELLAAAGDNLLLLVLDSVEDPNNFGACLRSADAVGVDAVIIPRHRGVGLTPAVYKAASGAAEVVPVYALSNLARGLEHIKQAGVRVIGASQRASKSLFDADLTGALAIVLGGEGRGMRALTERLCDETIQIPMAGRVESLNVSVSAGVLLYEVLRQRR